MEEINHVLKEKVYGDDMDSGYTLVKPKLINGEIIGRDLEWCGKDRIQVKQLIGLFSDIRTMENP